MKKHFILLLFIVTYTQAFSQEYIGLNKDLIKDKVSKIGGVLRTDTEGGDGLGKPAHLLMFQFPKDLIFKQGIFMMQFYSSDKACYQYSVSYIDDKFKKPIIDSLNKESYVRRGNEDVWENKKEKIAVIIWNYMHEGKITPQFSVVVKKTE